MANYENIMENIKRLEVLNRWYRFRNEKPSTELWQKKEFEYFIDNEDTILHYTIIQFDGKQSVVKIGGEDEINEQNLIKLNRLREIYNERFKEIEPEDHTQFSYYERLELLKMIGIDDSPTYKNLSNTGKHYFVAKILNIHKDNARKLIDGTYSAGSLDKEKIETFLTRYRKK